MGNRAVITTQNGYDNKGVGIYLHWNGGRDSVTAFLTYCKFKGYRSPTSDSTYAWARFCQVVGNFFGGSCSIGVGRVDRLDCDNYDNGVYIVDGWNIVGRLYRKGAEQDEYDLEEMLIGIDEAQPEKEQIGAETIKALLTNELYPMVYEDKIGMLQVGSTVSVFDSIYNKFERFEVLGFGENGKVVNGTDVSGIPYIKKYGDDIEQIENNPNNYLTKRKTWLIVEMTPPQSASDDDGANEQMVLI